MIFAVAGCFLYVIVFWRIFYKMEGTILIASKDNVSNKINKIYKGELPNNDNMLPGDLKRSPDESLKYKNTIIYIDSGFLSKVSKYFGKDRYLVYDISKFAKILAIKETLMCNKIFYYTAPPYQSSSSTKEEESKKEGYDKFIKKLRNKNVIVREGRCQPLKNAILDVWQANSTGDYDNEGFTLRGKVKTNNDGTYLIDTIVPKEYATGDITRPGHIHLKVGAPNQPILTTQLYFEGDPYLSDWEDKSMVMKLTEENGTKKANFDFVIEDYDEYDK